VIFLIFALAFPEEQVPKFVKAYMSTICQQKKRPIVCRGRLERQESISVSLAAEDMNRPCQGVALLATVATKGSISAMEILLSLIMKPK
jgi:hypothetical protein